MNTTAHIIRLAHLCAANSNREISTISRLATGSGATVGNLIAGAGITVRRAESAIEWFASHWPEGAEWPSDIPRPAPNLSQDRAA